MTTAADEARCGRRSGAIGGRAWLGFLLLGGTLDAEPVRAQDTHHVRASAGDNFHGDVEENALDGHAEVLWQDGVGGVDPSFFRHHAVADGDSGALSISSIFSLGGGAGDPIFVSPSNHSGASLEESIDPGSATNDTVTVTAQLLWGGSGSLVNGAGNDEDGSVSATLRVDDCQVTFRKRFYSTGSGSGDATECVGTATNFGSAGAGLLTVTRIRDAVGISSGTRFYVTASISGEAAPTTTLEYFDSGQYDASGQLTIEVAGAPYEFASPTFLTVPEPGDAALAATALAALSTLARRRRSVLA